MYELVSIVVVVCVSTSALEASMVFLIVMKEGHVVWMNLSLTCWAVQVILGIEHVSFNDTAVFSSSE